MAAATAAAWAYRESPLLQAAEGLTYAANQLFDSNRQQQTSRPGGHVGDDEEEELAWLGLEGSSSIKWMSALGPQEGSPQTSLADDLLGTSVCSSRLGPLRFQSPSTGGSLTARRGGAAMACQDAAFLGEDLMFSSEGDPALAPWSFLADAVRTLQLMGDSLDAGPDWGQRRYYGPKVRATSSRSTPCGTIIRASGSPLDEEAPITRSGLGAGKYRKPRVLEVPASWQTYQEDRFSEDSTSSSVAIAATAAQAYAAAAGSVRQSTSSHRRAADRPRRFEVAAAAAATASSSFTSSVGRQVEFNLSAAMAAAEAFAITVRGPEQTKQSRWQNSGRTAGAIQANGHREIEERAKTARRDRRDGSPARRSCSPADRVETVALTLENDLLTQEVQALKRRKHEEDLVCWALEAAAAETSTVERKQLMEAKRNVSILRAQLHEAQLRSWRDNSAAAHSQPLPAGLRLEACAFGSTAAACSLPKTAAASGLSTAAASSLPKTAATSALGTGKPPVPKATLQSFATIAASCTEAVAGLEAHSEMLRGLFELKQAPTAEVVLGTWGFVDELRKANAEWHKARAKLTNYRHHAGATGHDEQKPSWTEIVEQAANAERQVAAFRARLQSLMRTEGMAA